MQCCTAPIERSVGHRVSTMLTKAQGLSREWKTKNNLIKQQKREILPLIGLGVGIFALGTAAQYVIRTLKRMEEEKKNNNGNSGNDGDNDNNQKKDDKSNHHHDNLHKHETRSSAPPHDFPKKSFGIDIGSTSAKLAYRDGSIAEIIENKEGLRATPAALFKTSQESSIGSYAARQRWANASKVGIGYHTLIGSKAKDANVLEYISKLNLQDRLNDSNQGEISVLVGGSSISSSSMYTLIAKDLFATVENKVERISSIPVTISVPNFYNMNNIQAAMLAVENGGFTTRQYIPDSVAALVGAHNRGYLPKTDPVLVGKYLVLDIGGRLTQMSVINMTEKSYQVLGYKTLFNIGGEYINDELANYVATEYYNKNQIQLLNDTFSKQRIYDTIESVKIDLSKSLSSKVELPYITADINGPKHLHMEISRAKLEYLMTPMLNGMRTPLTELLTEVKLQNLNEIKSFLVVGGGARIPLAQKMTKEMLGLEPIIPSQPEEITALGASIYSSKYHN